MPNDNAVASGFQLSIASLPSRIGYLDIIRNRWTCRTWNTTSCPLLYRRCTSKLLRGLRPALVH